MDVWLYLWAKFLKLEFLHQYVYRNRIDIADCQLKVLYQFALPLAIQGEPLSTLASISYLFPFVYLMREMCYFSVALFGSLTTTRTGLSFSCLVSSVFWGKLCVKYFCSFPFGCIIFLWHLQDRSPIWKLAS